MTENIMPVTISSNSMVSISVVLPINQIEFTTNENGYEKLYHMTLKTHESVYKEPISFQEEISLDEWKKSLEYDETKIKKILEEILLNFELDITDENIELLTKMFDNLIDIYEKKYQIALDKQTRIMIKNLITRMSYDKLCIKQYVQP